MPQTRQLAAIMFTDIVGYTALMQENEQKAVALIKHYNAALNQKVDIHGGKVLNYYGDGSLCTFPSVTEAVNCAIDLQKDLQSEPNVPLRIGLHIGEVFFEEDKALGDGVNVASRIQSLGQANTILFSKEIFDKIKNHPEIKAVSLGLFEFKNVDEAMEIFALANEGLSLPKRQDMDGKLKHDLKKKKKTVRKNFTIAASLLILIIAGIFLYIKYLNKPKSTVEKSIAILPFTNMSNDEKQEYFAQGMMDEILNHLYKIGGLNVISRTSSMAYKDSKKTGKEIANELGVGNLLQGSVQKEGDHIRIIVQLINGKNDQYLWAETYDREFKDVFSIQSDIAQKVAGELKIKIDPDVKQRIESLPTQSTEAYTLYLKYKNIPNYGDDTLGLLEKAINLDPNFADAYAELAHYWLLQGTWLGELRNEEVLKKATPLLEKALQLNPNLASAHYYMANLQLWYRWDFSAVEKEYQKILQLYPSNIEVTSRFHDYLMSIGRFEEAQKNAINNFNNDKNYWANWVSLAYAYQYNNQPGKALETIEAAVSLFTGIIYLKVQFLRLCVLNNRFEKAIQAFDRIDSSSELKLHPLNLSNIAIAYYKTGQTGKAEIFLNELKRKSQHTPVGSPSYYLAALYTSMGKTDLAIQLLEKAYKEHEVEMYWLKVEPLFKPLHNDKRFQDIIYKIGFPK
jgi:TolB-like protein/class 3 adenylate cyclase/Tfp pilus assembly protein PilF